MSREFDRAVVSPSLLQAIDINKPLNPAFDLGMSEWMITDEEEILVNERSIDSGNKENSGSSSPSRKKPRPSLSLKKKCERFSKPVTDKELEDAAKGVIPTNTKCANDWALRNLRAWTENRNLLLPEDPVPDDLLSCTDASVLCRWLRCFV